MAKYWEIAAGQRAHIVLGEVIAKSRYHYLWTAKTVQKLKAHGLVDLVDPEVRWGWGNAKRVVITPAGNDAFHVALNAGVVRVSPVDETPAARRKEGTA